MKIIYFGTGAFGLPALEALAQSEHELLAVVTNVDKAKGRRLESSPSPIKEWAMKHGKTVIECADIHSDGILQQLKKLNADLYVVIAFGFLLPKTILELPKTTCLNVHSSLLPRYRGAAPIHWAIINGDTKSGVTVMRMTPKLDAGDILIQQEVPIEDADDYARLEKKLSEAGAQILLKGIRDIETGKARWTAQSENNLFYARKLTKDDGRIDWSQSADSLARKVRALKEWPGSYFFCDTKRVIIQEAAAEAGGSSAKPGTVLSASPQKGMRIQCGSGVLHIKNLQMEGRKAMPAAEFIKGFPLKEGQLIE